MVNLNYLVVGTGRSGTVFLARFLTNIDLPCGHETFFDYEGIDAAIERLNGIKSHKLSLVSTHDFSNGKANPLDKWVDTDSLVADSSYLAAPFLNHSCLKDTKIIHAVRNPIKVVSSFVNSLGYFEGTKPKDNYETFIYKHLPELTEEMTQYERACLYYIRWNELIEKTISGRFIFYRVEENPETLLTFLGKSFIPKEKLFSDNKVNTFHKDKEFTLNDLRNSSLKREFVRIGRRYGYPMSEYLLI